MTTRIFRFFRALALASAAPGGALAAACGPALLQLETPAGPVDIRVAIADSPEERARGLMGVKAMDRDAGMLFVFPDVAPRAFWMKNTPLSLDILFFDAEGRLCGRVDQATPFSETSLPSGCAAKSALELVGGVATELGLRMGARVRHPSFGANAAWPCE